MPASSASRSSAALAYVGLAGNDATIELLDRALGLVQILGRGQGIVVRLDLTTDVDGDDVGTLLGHAYGMGSALSTCRPRDESDLSF